MQDDATREARAGKPVEKQQDRRCLLVGADCGATSVRVTVAEMDGSPSARGMGAGANLLNGIPACWSAILAVIDSTLAQIGADRESMTIMLGVGIAGGHAPHLLDAFRADTPPGILLSADTDSFIHLLGAHGGRPGSVAAFGTGSIGESLMPDGSRRLIGGYGFPAGDRASGAWLGRKASQYLQDAIDGLTVCDALALDIAGVIGTTDRGSVIAWLGQANPADFGRLAPPLLRHRDHPFTARVLEMAACDAATMVHALMAHGAGPVAVSGGLSACLTELMPPVTQSALVVPIDDGVAGALLMARQAVQPN